MNQLIFDEKTMMDGNIFQFENRLKSSLNRYTENGMLLTTYFSIDEDKSTVDRGIQDIEELFGNRSPIRLNKIENFPINNFTGLNTENTEENNIEDFNASGDFTIIPGLIIPKQNDVFFINHLKMIAVFIVTGVSYDSMKIDGNYKVSYRLHSTSENVVNDIERRVIEEYYTDLNSIGTDVNPIIRKDNYILKCQIEKMMYKMIDSYKALFYNKKHNCFLYYDQQTGTTMFDMCGNEFMAKYGLMNYINASNIIVLHDKINDPQKAVYYMNSVYNWIEMDAPERLLQKFPYITTLAEGYVDSSFELWGEGDIEIILPLSLLQNGNKVTNSFFDDVQFNAFLDKDNEPNASEYDKLIWKFIHKSGSLSIRDISPYIGDVIFSSIKHKDVYLYTPIIIYIMKKILATI